MAYIKLMNDNSLIALDCINELLSRSRIQTLSLKFPRNFAPAGVEGVMVDVFKAIFSILHPLTANNKLLEQLPEG